MPLHREVIPSSAIKFLDRSKVLNERFAFSPSSSSISGPSMSLWLMINVCKVELTLRLSERISIPAEVISLRLRLSFFNTVLYCRKSESKMMLSSPRRFDSRSDIIIRHHTSSYVIQRHHTSSYVIPRHHTSSISFEVGR